MYCILKLGFFISENPGTRDEIFFHLMNSLDLTCDDLTGQSSECARTSSDEKVRKRTSNKELTLMVSTALESHRTDSGKSRTQRGRK